MTRIPLRAFGVNERFITYTLLTFILLALEGCERDQISSKLLPEISAGLCIDLPLYCLKWTSSQFVCTNKHRFLNVPIYSCHNMHFLLRSGQCI